MSVLGILIGSSWGYTHFVQDKNIEQLQSTLKQKKQKLANDQHIADRYNEILDKFVKKNIYLKKFKKTLPDTLDASSMYVYLNSIRPSYSNLNINYTYLKSKKKKKRDYGITTANISGQGNYQDLFSLIHNIAKSSPIVKVHNLVINPQVKKENYNNVKFTLQLAGYFSKKQLVKNIKPRMINGSKKIRKNPFYPLIRGVKPNKDNLPNVEKSKLVGIGKNLVYIVDQNGKVQILHTGDKVYLGYLSSASIKKQKATFKLNKGGILDKVVLKLNKSDKSKN